jgi:hypothetical protein
VNDSADIDASARLDQAPGQRDMGTPELFAIRVTGFVMEHTDQIDDGIAARKESCQRGAVMQIRLDDFNRWQEFQIPTVLTAPRGHNDVTALRHKAGHEMTTDEPRSTKHNNSFVAHGVFILKFEMSGFYGASPGTAALGAT